MPGGSNKGSSQQQPNLTPGEQQLYNQTGQNISALQKGVPISDFTSPNPTQVAGLSGTQQQSTNLMNQNLSGVQSGQAQAGIITPGQQYQNLLKSAQTSPGDSPLLQETGRYAGLMGSTGGPLEQSPIVQAGTRYFQNAIAPGIENQATLSGLGRSTANTSALSAAQAQTMLPLLQGEQARQQQLITGEQGRQDTIQAQQQARSDQLTQAGQQRTDTLATQQQARMDQLVNQGMQVGDAQRQVQQEQYNAQAQDFLRRQGISEQALFGPMGQLPSTFGQNVQQTGKQTGMFGTVICTELYRQGYLDDETYKADSDFGKAIYEEFPRLMKAYWYIGVPIAQAMSRSRMLTALVAPVGILWAKAIKWIVCNLGEKGSILCFA